MSLDLEPLAIAEVTLIRPRRLGDERGWFVELFHRERLREHGIDFDVVQSNAAWSPRAGTIRGLHYQLPPFAQAKLIRVARGAIFDVAVDLRRSSPSFGRHVAVRLDAAHGAQLLVPRGFAHGYCTLEPDTEVNYLVDAPYDRETERGVIWSDPALDIAWPLSPAEATVSPKDAALPRLEQQPELFA